MTDLMRRLAVGGVVCGLLLGPSALPATAQGGSYFPPVQKVDLAGRQVEGATVGFQVRTRPTGQDPWTSYSHNDFDGPLTIGRST